MCINTSFFLLLIYSNIWLYHNLFIHSPVDEHLGCFQLFAEQSCYEHSYVSLCMDTVFTYSYGFMFTPRSPKSASPDTNNQLPVQQVHLDNPTGLLNQHVHNSSCYAALFTPTTGFLPTFSILLKALKPQA